MHWATILSALACALTFAYLVLAEAWSLESALLAIVGMVAVLGGALFALGFAIGNPADRRALLAIILETMRQDMAGFLRWLGLRR